MVPYTASYLVCLVTESERLTPFSNSHPSALVRRKSAGALIVLMVILWLGLLLQATAEGATLSSIAGPECLIRNWIGERACPGCGLTRASSLVLHGEFSTAMAVNAGGFFLVGVAVFWSLIHSVILIRGQRSAALVGWLTVGRHVLLFGVILGWVLRSV